MEERDLEKIIRMAEEGDPRMQYALYTRYMEGRDVPMDSDKALEYLMQSAEQEYPPALLELGEDYLFEDGFMEQDVKRGMLLIKKAAAKGDAGALYLLGKIYDDARNPERAAECYYWSAMRGDWRAQIELGRLYGCGVVFPQDQKEQLYWYEKATESGHYQAYTNLALMYHNGFFGKIEPDEEKSEYYLKLSREAREREMEESGITEEEWLEQRQLMIDSELKAMDDWNDMIEQWIEEEDI